MTDEQGNGPAQSPLLLAVDRGDYELVADGPAPPGTGTEGQRALEIARHWCEAGVEAELRRRSGAAGAAEHAVVRHDGGRLSHEVSLGGLTVRTGHAAILTRLESAYGIAPSFDVLKHRALAEPDIGHVVWFETVSVLCQRQLSAPADLDVAWNPAAALAVSPDPLERYFGADVLCCVDTFDGSEDFPFNAPLADLFLPWVAREEDPRVLRVLTDGLAGSMDPRAVAPLTTLTRHPDDRVRELAVQGLPYPMNTGNEEAVTAVVARARDDVPAVRRAACRALGSVPAGYPEVTVAHVPYGPLRLDALAGCLSDAEEDVRVTAAGQLAMNDDPRADGVLCSYEGIGQDSPYYWELYSVWPHRERQAEAR